jgi:hypothetical protein
MPDARAKPPNPKRVAAGKMNRAKRGPLTAAGRERLRQSALANRPWEHSTGPRTPAGRAQSVINGKSRQRGARSVREVRAELKQVCEMVRQMEAARAVAGGE